MKLGQGCFSYLPDLTDDQITLQIQYALDNSWAVSIEYTDDPHPRNSYWDMWGLPLFDAEKASVILFEVTMCRETNPAKYVKVVAFDNTRGVESCVMSFIVARPKFEPGFRLVRQETKGRILVYTLDSYATHLHQGERYIHPPEYGCRIGDYYDLWIMQNYYL